LLLNLKFLQKEMADTISVW